eukprot:CAMPEP_0174825652 /NCGR_PEP_ID=MMETSP1107-20130205/42966_1 /TAXON_ID=36770 /ORGANISM="Paraphysomonas vestita, Strain GFlagA" /LENGTH=390 /DNA_ID=CAMNT_0016057463 /DNA_START=1118 /DNA_END=2287 /DNA_ORIENTATION=+
MATKYIHNQGRHIPIVVEARNLLNRLDQEKQANDMLANALQSMDMNLLENAVKNARNMKPPLSSPLVKDCLNAMKDLKTTATTISSKTPLSPRPNSPVPIPTGPALLSAVSNRVPVGISNDTSVKSVPSRYVPSPEPPVSTPNRFDPSNYGSVNSTLSSSSSISSSISSSNYLQQKQSIQSSTPPPPPPPPPVTSSIIPSQQQQQQQQQQQRGRAPRRSLMRQESHSLSPPRRPAAPIPPPRRRSPPKLETSEYLEKFETPIPLKRGGRTSVLTRQLSRDDMADMTSLHEAIASLVDASSSEEGITENDIFPLQNLLNEFQSSGNQLTQQVSDLMMAREELLRAQQQLELQNKLLAITPQTPHWKTRNLLVQASKIGMNNYHVVKHYKQL